jgi:D-lyxose ketol-isomerase
VFSLGGLIEMNDETKTNKNSMIVKLKWVVGCCICDKDMKIGSIYGKDVFSISNGQLTCCKEHQKKAQDLIDKADKGFSQ